MKNRKQRRSKEAQSKSRDEGTNTGVKSVNKLDWKKWGMRDEGDGEKDGGNWRGRRKTIKVEDKKPNRGMRKSFFGWDWCWKLLKGLRSLYNFVVALLQWWWWIVKIIVQLELSRIMNKKQSNNYGFPHQTS